MRSVKRLLDRLAKPRAFRVLDHHGGPRQRLKRNPVQADRATKRENHNNAADAMKHVADAIHPLLVSHTDAAASCVKQPVAEGEAKAAADGRIKVTIRFAVGI